MSASDSETTAGSAAADASPAETRPTTGSILFPQGLPGFPGATRFMLRPAPVGDGDFLLLQSADDAELRFLVLRYTPGLLPLDPDDIHAACERLGVQANHAAVLLMVTSGHETGNDGTSRPALHVNLRAPLVLDTFHRVGAQPVLTGATYPVRHRLRAA